MQNYILIVWLACTFMASAQDINTDLPWKKKAKLAKEMVQQNDYSKAGQYSKLRFGGKSLRSRQKHE